MSRYIRAASELLIRYGKPMHYTTIAFAAVGLGLLETDSRNPAIPMSSALSKEVALNPNSIIKKNKEGVYYVVFGERIGFYLLEKNYVGNRLAILSQMLKAKDEIQIVRKILFVSRRILSVVGNDKELVVLNGNDSFILDFLLYDETKKRMDNYTKISSLEYEGHNKKVVFDKEICIAIEMIRDGFKFKEITYTLDFTVSLFEFLYKYNKNGSIKLVGKDKSISLRLKSVSGGGM